MEQTPSTRRDGVARGFTTATSLDASSHAAAATHIATDHHPHPALLVVHQRGGTTATSSFSCSAEGDVDVEEHYPKKDLLCPDNVSFTTSSLAGGGNLTMTTTTTTITTTTTLTEDDARRMITAARSSSSSASPTMVAIPPEGLGHESVSLSSCSSPQSAQSPRRDNQYHTLKEDDQPGRHTSGGDETRRADSADAVGGRITGQQGKRRLIPTTWAAHATETPRAGGSSRHCTRSLEETLHTAGAACASPPPIPCEGDAAVASSAAVQGGVASVVATGLPPPQHHHHQQHHPPPPQQQQQRRCAYPHRTRREGSSSSFSTTASSPTAENAGSARPPLLPPSSGTVQGGAASSPARSGGDGTCGHEPQLHHLHPPPHHSVHHGGSKKNRLPPPSRKDGYEEEEEDDEDDNTDNYLAGGDYGNGCGEGVSSPTSQNSTTGYYGFPLEGASSAVEPRFETGTGADAEDDDDGDDDSGALLRPMRQVDSEDGPASVATASTDAAVIASPSSSPSSSFVPVGGDGGVAGSTQNAHTVVGPQERRAAGASSGAAVVVELSHGLRPVGVASCTSVTGAAICAAPSAATHVLPIPTRAVSASANGVNSDSGPLPSGTWTGTSAVAPGAAAPYPTSTSAFGVAALVALRQRAGVIEEPRVGAAAPCVGAGGTDTGCAERGGGGTASFSAQPPPPPPPPQSPLDQPLPIATHARTRSTFSQSLTSVTSPKESETWSPGTSSGAAGGATATTGRGMPPGAAAAAAGGGAVITTVAVPTHADASSTVKGLVSTWAMTEDPTGVRSVCSLSSNTNVAATRMPTSAPATAGLANSAAAPMTASAAGSSHPRLPRPSGTGFSLRQFAPFYELAIHEIITECERRVANAPASSREAQKHNLRGANNHMLSVSAHSFNSPRAGSPTSVVAASTGPTALPVSEENAASMPPPALNADDLAAARIDSYAHAEIPQCANLSVPSCGHGEGSGATVTRPPNALPVPQPLPHFRTVSDHYHTHPSTDSTHPPAPAAPPAHSLSHHAPFLMEVPTPTDGAAATAAASVSGGAMTSSVSPRSQTAATNAREGRYYNKCVPPPLASSAPYGPPEESVLALLTALGRYLNYGDTAPMVFIAALAYLSRVTKLCASDFASVTVDNWYRLTTTAVLVASKMYNEAGSLRMNRYFAESSGIPLSELNKLELDFLYLIDFDLLLEEHDVECWVSWMESLALRHDMMTPLQSFILGQAPRTPSVVSGTATTQVSASLVGLANTTAAAAVAADAVAYAGSNVSGGNGGVAYMPPPSFTRCLSGDVPLSGVMSPPSQMSFSSGAAGHATTSYGSPISFTSGFPSFPLSTLGGAATNGSLTGTKDVNGVVVRRCVLSPMAAAFMRATTGMEVDAGRGTGSQGTDSVLSDYIANAAAIALLPRSPVFGVTVQHTKGRLFSVVHGRAEPPTPPTVRQLSRLGNSPPSPLGPPLMGCHSPVGFFRRGHTGSSVASAAVVVPTTTAASARDCGAVGHGLVPAPSRSSAVSSHAHRSEGGEGPISVSAATTSTAAPPPSVSKAPRSSHSKASSSSSRHATPTASFSSQQQQQQRPSAPSHLWAVPACASMDDVASKSPEQTGASLSTSSSTRHAEHGRWASSSRSATAAAAPESRAASIPQSTPPNSRPATRSANAEPAPASATKRGGSRWAQRVREVFDVTASLVRGQLKVLSPQRREEEDQEGVEEDPRASTIRTASTRRAQQPSSASAVPFPPPSSSASTTAAGAAGGVPGVYPKSSHASFSAHPSGASAVSGTPSSAVPSQPWQQQTRATANSQREVMPQPSQQTLPAGATWSRDVRASAAGTANASPSAQTQLPTTASTTSSAVSSGGTATRSLPMRSDGVNPFMATADLYTSTGPAAGAPPARRNTAAAAAAAHFPTSTTQPAASSSSVGRTSHSFRPELNAPPHAIETAGAPGGHQRGYHDPHGLPPAVAEIGGRQVNSGSASAYAPLPRGPQQQQQQQPPGTGYAAPYMTQRAAEAAREEDGSYDEEYEEGYYDEEGYFHYYDEEDEEFEEEEEGEFYDEEDEEGYYEEEEEESTVYGRHGGGPATAGGTAGGATIGTGRGSTQMMWPPPPPTSAGVAGTQYGGRRGGPYHDDYDDGEEEEDEDDYFQRCRPPPLTHSPPSL